MQIVQKSTSNFTSRGLWHPLAIVIHTAEGNRDQILSTFQHEPKSSHYFVLNDGTVWQFVDENLAAFTQGVVDNPTAIIVLQHPNINPNLYCISIEHEAFAGVGINEVQYDATSQLIVDICERWGIMIDREHIIRHQEIRASKSCPGVTDVDKLVQMALLKKTIKLTMIQILVLQIGRLKDAINKLLNYGNKTVVSK